MPTNSARKSAITPDERVELGHLGALMATFLERYPNARKLRIISAMDGDHGALSHHQGLHYLGSPTAALDIGAKAKAGAAALADFAKWLYDNHADSTVELIYAPEDPTETGFYVKNQKRSPDGSLYGGPDAISHRGCVHWATSEALLEQAQQPAGRTFTARDVERVAVVPAPGEPAETVGIANTGWVWGWDASSHDWGRGPMDLSRAHADGISFFTHKATEGGDWKDPHYRQALERARSAGIPVMGCYHYLWPNDIEAQMNFWMDYVTSQTPWWKDVPWIWQIDAEEQGLPRPPSPDEIRRAVAAVQERMAREGTTAYVIVYAPRWLYANSLGPGYDIWNSDYTGSGAPRRFKEQYQGVTDFSPGWTLMSGRKPRILQFASDAVVGGQGTCDVNKFDGDLHALIRLCGRDPARIGTPVTQLVADKVAGRVLTYDHSIAFLRQETPWDCGPASTQIVLNALGIDASESLLIKEIGTNEGGTKCVQLIESVLDRRVPGAGYTSVEMPDDPPTRSQREALWNNIVQSIDAGYGLVMNWVVPEGNYPVGIKGSVSPSYRSGTYWHYVACMGYDSNPAQRALWIADSGFCPNEYWISFDQAATLIPPKAYAYAAATAERALATPEPDRERMPRGQQNGWTHVFSDGISRDAQDVLVELMEFAIQSRKVDGMPVIGDGTRRGSHEKDTTERIGGMAKKALCVGINDYPLRNNDLNGCVNDARAWADLLVQHYGFASADVTLLLDSEATKANIMSCLATMISEAKPGDTLVFTNSSHGTYVVDQDGDEKTYDEAICPYDCEDNLIVDDELRELFAQLPRGVSLTVILDSCFSGTGTRAPFDTPDHYLERFMDPESINRARFKRADLLYAKPNHSTKYPESGMNDVLLSGCSDKQRSGDAYIDGAYHGVMTYYALKAIEEADYEITLQDLAVRINELIRDSNFDQTPQLEGKKANKARYLFSDRSSSGAEPVLA